MKKLLVLTALATLVVAPSIASAATACRQARHDNQVAGTVVGAIAGGLLGNAVSRGGGRSGGTVIGAVGGAVIGNQLAGGGHCPEGYEAYDDGRRVDVRREGYVAVRPPIYDDHGDRVYGSERTNDRAQFEQTWRDRGASWDRHWQTGEYLPDGFAADQRYYVADYRNRHLRRPARGYHWMAYGDDYLQVRNDGRVGRTVYNTRY